ncbi:MAG: VWA domain-containing protein [Pirellulaceae bacterium]|nr:VWA domain-containing protein [Pirellulaceae bacterium]
MAKTEGKSQPSSENRNRIDTYTFELGPDPQREGEPSTDEFDALKDLIQTTVDPESFTDGAEAPDADDWHLQKMMRKKYDRVEHDIPDDGSESSTIRRPYRILPLIDEESSPELIDLLNNVWDEPSVEQHSNSSSFQTGKSRLRVSVDPTTGTLIASPSEEELKTFKALVDSLNSEPALAGKLNEQSSAETEPPRTWRRVNATPNTTRLMVGQNDELKLNGTQVHIHVDGFRARVVMDTFFYNDRPQALEGTFKLRLPDDASLFYLAFGDSVHDFSKDPNNEKELLKAMQTQYVSLEPNGIGTARTGTWQNVKEARVVTREKAAYAYNETVRRQVDPALAEWAGAGVFQARVFPLQPHRMHRIVVGYDVNLQHSAKGMGLRFELPLDAGFTQVEMSLDATAADSIQVTPKCVPVTRNERSVYFWSKPEGNAIELLRTDAGPRLLVSPTPAPAASPSESKPYFAAQVSPELLKSAATSSRRAIFLLDTSLSSNPDKFNVWLKLLEQTLTQNQDSIDSFAVLMFSVDQHYWREHFSPNTPEQVQQLRNDCQQIVLEGATDLYAAARKLNQTPWLQDGGATPDVFLLSDGAATWGESSAPMIRTELANAKIGGLFAYQTGMSGTEIQTLRYLANSFGGAVFSVANESELALASTAHRSRPWQVISLSLPGTTDLLTAGRVEWLYPGQALMLAGRGAPNGPLTMELQQGDVRQTVQIEFASERTDVSELVSRLYGQIAVTQLESLGALTSEVAASYARHYRVAGETCSLVMLESEADYQRFNIRPEDDWLMIQTQAAGSLIERTIKQGSELLLDPKARFVKWLTQLESAPGLGFQIPPALKLALDQIQVPIVATAIETKSRTVAGVSEEYLATLLKEELDYDRIQSEADRRAKIGRDDAVKVWSNLIERHPMDAEVLRDVAWSLMELDRADHAFGLLQRVARLRPFEGAIYLAIANALQQARQADLALVYYEIALNAKFERAGEDFPRITANDYEQLLQSIVAGEMSSSLKDYAGARLESLRRDFPDRPELAVTMFWNTDRTDVDLHVTEPTEEVCNFQRRQTRIGGQMTSDITTGFGPEMYSVAKAPAGGYHVESHYFRNDGNRTKLACRVLVTVVQRQDSGKRSRSLHVVRLNEKDEKQTIAKINR